MASELEVGKIVAKTAATTGSSPLEVARLEVKDEGVNLGVGMGPKLAFYMPHDAGSFEGAAIAAKKEATSDSNEATSLSFSTIPNAFGAPVERLAISSTGQVNITNTSDPALKLHNTTGGENDTAAVVFGVSSGTADGPRIEAKRGVGVIDLNLFTADATSQTNSSAALTLAGSNNLATFSGGITVSGGITSLGGFLAVTIVGGGITVTSSAVRLATQGGAGTDDLLGINGGTDGSILIIQSVSSNVVVVKHSTGGTGENIQLAGGVDFSLDSTNDVLVLVKFGTNWREVSRSNNS